MNPESMFEVLAGYHPLSDDLKAALAQEMIFMSLPKNHLLLQAPRISTHAYFLTKGFAISYSYYMGRRITQDFYTSGNIIVAFESFFEQVPSDVFIQLVKDSHVYCISYESVQKLFEKYLDAQHLHRAIMNRIFLENQERIRDMQRLTAHQQLDKLKSRYPEIELIVSQDAIASYLGITAQSLARIKRQKDKR